MNAVASKAAPPCVLGRGRGILAMGGKREPRSTMKGHDLEMAIALGAILVMVLISMAGKLDLTRFF
jgi:hypothetical protein